MVRRKGTSGRETEMPLVVYFSFSPPFPLITTNSPTVSGGNPH